MASRVESIKRHMSGSPEYCMRMLLSKMTAGEMVPSPDKYYVFIYKAKTPNIQYDQHPLIACTGVYKWGFTGFNYHWEDYRRYSWLEVFSNVYEITDEEINDVRNFPIAKYKTT